MPRPDRRRSVESRGGRMLRARVSGSRQIARPPGADPERRVRSGQDPTATRRVDRGSPILATNGRLSSISAAARPSLPSRSASRPRTRNVLAVPQMWPIDRAIARLLFQMRPRTVVVTEQDERPANLTERTPGEERIVEAPGNRQRFVMQRRCALQISGRAGNKCQGGSGRAPLRRDPPRHGRGRAPRRQGSRLPSPCPDPCSRSTSELSAITSRWVPCAPSGPAGSGLEGSVGSPRAWSAAIVCSSQRCPSAIRSRKYHSNWSANSRRRPVRALMEMGSVRFQVSADRKLSSSAASRSSKSGPSGPKIPGSAALRQIGAPFQVATANGGLLAGRSEAAPGRTPGSSPASRSAARRPSQLFGANEALVHQRRHARPRHVLGPSAPAQSVAVADGLGSLEREAAHEHAEPPKQPLLGLLQQVVAPGDRAAQRLLARGQVARAAGQQRQAVAPGAPASPPARAAGSAPPPARSPAAARPGGRRSRPRPARSRWSPRSPA